MSRPIAAVASDLHLETHAWKDHLELAGDAYYGLAQVVDYVIANRIRNLALLGDVFNKKYPDSHSVCVASREVRRCQDHGIFVVFIEGQHELAVETPWLHVSDWPRHIHKLPVEIGAGHRAYGLSWMPQADVVPALAAVPSDCEVLFCHQVWGDFHGSKIEHECDFSDVAGHVKVLVTGDYHKHFTLVARNAGGNKMLVGSPGSTCLQSINEDPHKAFFLLHDDLTLESVPLKSRRVHRYEVGTADQLDNLLAADMVDRLCEPQADVPANIAKNIVQVVFPRDLPNAYTRIEKAFGRRAHLFATPVRTAATEVVVDVEERRERASRGLEGALALLEPQRGRTYRSAVRLWRTTSIASELDAMRDEFLRDKDEVTIGRLLGGCPESGSDDQEDQDAAGAECAGAV